MSVKLEYAFDSAGVQLVHVSSVANGLACNCVCPQCGAKLVAKNSSTNKRIAHFQHYQSIECAHAVETSLHLLAKEILDEKRQIALPGYKERFIIKDKNYRGWGPLYDKEIEFLYPELISIEKVHIEKSINSIRPDLIIWVNEEPILVEIYVTHKVDEPKLQIIKDNDIAAIEIDLHSLNRTITKDDLASVLITGQCSKWIYQPTIDAAKEAFQKELDNIVNEEQLRRDKEYAIIKRKRDRKRHKIQYLDKAKKWCNAKSDFQLLGIEEKYGYSIFKQVSKKLVERCPITTSQSIERCLFCEYNPKFYSTSNRFIRASDTQVGFVRCLFDIMKDRYYNQDRDF